MLTRRVIKIGGSCLENPDLPGHLNAWINRQPAAENWVIVGGGECIEAMRTLYRRFPLNAEAMHWRCIQILDATWGIIAELFPHWSPLDSPHLVTQRLAQSPRNETLIVRVQSFYGLPTVTPNLPLSALSSPLPVGWETTTDSIAAWLCTIIKGQEIVLLKSCLVPPAAEPDELRRMGIVDDAFPEAIPEDVRLRVIQLP